MISGMATTTAAAARKAISSFGFSGAGFLTSYHLGAAQCLMKHGFLLKPGELPSVSSSTTSSSSTHSLHTAAPTLTGVSGGSIVAASVSCGVEIEDSMTALLDLARQTKQVGGILDTLHPKVSLVDQVEIMFKALTKDVDKDFVMRRIDGGRLLRIGLAERRNLQFNVTEHQNAYVYVDQYRCVDDIIAACILSSYIPGLTGPYKVGGDLLAVARANERIVELLELGHVKDRHGQPIHGEYMKEQQSIPKDSVLFWDGGLADCFPVVNEDTCVVSCFYGTFTNHSICPPPTVEVKNHLHINDRVKLHVTMDNAIALRQANFTSDESVLMNRFELGYNNTYQFLKDNQFVEEDNLIAVKPTATGTIGTQTFSAVS